MADNKTISLRSYLDSNEPIDLLAKLLKKDIYGREVLTYALINYDYARTIIENIPANQRLKAVLTPLQQNFNRL